jgi:hypothetical protein
MLASLLPGLRELRAPLAAGYTWIFGLWILLHDLNVGSGPLRAFRDDIVQLANWAGKPILITAATFAAYIIGTISLSATHWVDKTLSAITMTGRHQTLTPIESVGTGRTVGPIRGSRQARS